MSRVTNRPASRARRAKKLKLAKGFWGRRKNLRNATETVNRALRFAYIHRKKKKSDFRRLWIGRINVAARAQELTYSKLISGLDKGGSQLNRKTLSNLAIFEAGVFEQIVDFAKGQLN